MNCMAVGRICNFISALKGLQWSAVRKRGLLKMAAMHFQCICLSLPVTKTEWLKSAVHGEAHARAERLKNKLYGSTLNSN